MLISSLLILSFAFTQPPQKETVKQAIAAVHAEPVTVGSVRAVNSHLQKQPKQKALSAKAVKSKPSANNSSNTVTASGSVKRHINTPPPPAPHAVPKAASKPDKKP